MKEKYCKTCGINLYKPTQKQQFCSRQCVQDWRSNERENLFLKQQKNGRNN